MRITQFIPAVNQVANMIVMEVLVEGRDATVVEVMAEEAEVRNQGNK